MLANWISKDFGDFFFSTNFYLHSVRKLIEVSPEYKLPLCFELVDLNKEFDSAETEEVVEVLVAHGVPSQPLHHRASRAARQKILLLH